MDLQPPSIAPGTDVASQTPTAAHLPAVGSSLALLRQHTRIEHARLEDRLDIFTRLQGRDEYRALLIRMYGLYDPLEARLLEAGHRHALPLDLAARRKAPLLERDLAVLGLDPVARAAIPRCAALPVLDSAAAALGCLYVLEGATLGGQLIARHLDRHLGIGTDTGGAFFTAYGERVGAMWRTVCAVLAADTCAPGEEEAMIGAARATFEAFEAWLLQAGAPWCTAVPAAIATPS